MTQIVVVFHSGYGHTLPMAQAVAQGADAGLLAIDAEGGNPTTRAQISDRRPSSKTRSTQPAPPRPLGFPGPDAALARPFATPVSPTGTPRPTARVCLAGLRVHQSVH
jgi:hypothetical protein